MWVKTVSSLHKRKLTWVKKYGKENTLTKENDVKKVILRAHACKRTSVRSVRENFESKQIYIDKKIH